MGPDYPRPSAAGLNLVCALPKTDDRRTFESRLVCHSLREFNSMSVDTPTQADESVGVAEGEERLEPSMAPSVRSPAVAPQDPAGGVPKGEAAPAPGLVAKMRKRLKPVVAWVLRVDAKAVALVGRIPVKPKVLAWSMLGVGLSIWAAGLVLYFTSPTPEEVAAAGPPVQEAGPAPSPKPEAPVPVVEKKEADQPAPEPAVPKASEPEAPPVLSKDVSSSLPANVLVERPGSAPPAVPAPSAPERPRESALASDSEGPVLGKIQLEKPLIAPVRPRVIDSAREDDSAPERPAEKPAAKDASSARTSAADQESTQAARAPGEKQSAAEGAPPPGGVARPDNAVDSVFGADQSGNGIPDGLDRWMAKTFQSKVAQEAAQAYYRSALPLANKAYLGVSLSKSEKGAVMKAAECYLITAHEEGMRGTPNLNDRVLMMGGDAAERIKGLFKQVEGFDYSVKGVRKLACS